MGGCYMYVSMNGKLIMIVCIVSFAYIKIYHKFYICVLSRMQSYLVPPSLLKLECSLWM